MTSATIDVKALEQELARCAVKRAELETKVRAYENSIEAKNAELRGHWREWRLLARDESVPAEWRRIARRQAGMPGA
jgi:chromosome segregation ATPase